MKFAVLLGVCFFALCTSKASSALTWKTGVQYLYIRLSKTYSDAQAYCKRKGGMLAEPRTEAENTIVAKLTGGRVSFIGFNDKKKEGKWVSGTTGAKTCFTKWYTNEPNNYKNEDCVEINFGKRGFWNDRSCGSTRPFVCQKNAS